jgi:hypothetical protein
MKLTPVINYIKLFWHNLCSYMQIAQGFELGFDARAKIRPKKFMKLTPVANVIKLFTAVSYLFS